MQRTEEQSVNWMIERQMLSNQNSPRKRWRHEQSFRELKSIKKIIFVAWVPERRKRVSQKTLSNEIMARKKISKFDQRYNSIDSRSWADPKQHKPKEIYMEKHHSHITNVNTYKNVLQITISREYLISRGNTIWMGIKFSAEIRVQNIF